MKRSDKEIVNAIRRVDCWLSPENLHCDGEVSRGEAKARAKLLNAERDKLVKELGREPTFEEMHAR